MELYDLAEKLGNHTNLLKLALKLGFRQTTWMLYKASNTRRDGRICIDGTLDMLIDWKNDTPQVSQKALLNEALVFAGFAEFAGECCTRLVIMMVEGLEQDSVLLLYGVCLD